MTKESTFVEGICGICPGACAVEIEMKDGKIENLKPSEKHGPSAICLRGAKAKAVVYSEDRLKTPLIRTGEKGTYEFREATWEEAIEYAAKGFNKIKDTYGPQALVSHVGRGGFDKAFDDFMSISMPDGNLNGFFAPLGSPNGGSVGSLCYVAFGIFAPYTTMGLKGPEISPDFDNADTIFNWGANPPTGSPPFLNNKLKALRKKGTRIVTIDHYDSIMSRNSDEAFFVRTGSDIFLIMGLIKYLVEENKYDKEFVEGYTYGFDELVDYAKTFSLDRVLEETGLSEEDFCRIGELISRDRVSLNTYTGLEYTNSGVQSIRSLYSLWAIAGHLDKKGGILLSKPKNYKPFPKDKVGHNYKIRAIGEKEFPLFHKLTNQPQMIRFPEAVLNEDPYKVAGLINIGSAMTYAYPNTKKYVEALKKLEMHVVVDRFMTNDCKYADVVLPSTTHFEDETYVVYPGMVRRRKRIIEPIGQARTDILILHDIAEKMGFGEYYPADEEDIIRTRFGHMPEVMEKLLAGEEFVEVPMKKAEPIYEKYNTGGLRDCDDKPGFNTPTGKFEFKSTILESYGYEGLPVYTEAQEGRENTPNLYEKYPLILNSGARIQTTFRSQHLNIADLVKIQENPLVHISREDAEARSIEDGDKVRVSSPRGSIIMEARISSGLRKGDTEINVGGGQDSQLGLWKDANVNFLTDERNQDPISGFPVFKHLLCQVEKID